MATYVIGDVQGCYEQLLALLDKIHYNQKLDTLWFAGDIVNRGPHSLETLRFIKALPPDTVCVLGNHDLALIAFAYQAVPDHFANPFQTIFEAPDQAELIHWLRHRPILHHDPRLKFTLTHAGIYPTWDLDTAIKLAKEFEALLQGPQFIEFLLQMYGNEPTHWTESLTGWDRARFITNAFTRMRFCDADGGLELATKDAPQAHPTFIPWYAFPNRPTAQDALAFGHWASLEGKCNIDNIYALDTGCVWGKCLTAFCIESKQRISVPCGPQI